MNSKRKELTVLQQFTTFTGCIYAPNHYSSHDKSQW